MNAFVLNLTSLVFLMATLTFTWVQVLATLPSSVNKHHWPDLAAGQWQDVVRLLGVHTAAPQGELLLRARQQPQQHLERKRTSTSAPYVVFAVTSGQQSTHCRHWSQAEWEGWLSIFSTKVCVFRWWQAAEHTEVLWDRRLRLAFSGGVNTSRSNGSM